jgi:hypothetical protein
MATYNINMLKSIFTFLIQYISIRIEHIDSMSINELYAMFRIFDPNFPFYYNFNNIYTNEMFEVKVK